ncbi:MAG: hypothetical protein J5824_10770 [Lachnospiraceae bacterium]|nr:hypothetical protein [Lachnospiraceae bacterium]
MFDRCEKMTITLKNSSDGILSEAPSDSKKQVLITIVACILLTLICVTINSKNSFLYELQDCDDAQCFMTVARCMRRGDVLYKDVYEHKGIVLYVLYLIANIISRNSFIGVYFIELFSFYLFLFFSLRTLRLFCHYDFLNYGFLILIAISATSVDAFRAGGQCEEFALSLLAVSIYLVLKQCLKLKEKDLSRYSFVIGLCFAIVFWLKYTMTGFYIGYVLGILAIGIKNKKAGFIVKNAMFFLIGACSGTAPVLAYFLYNNAIADLWQVYFYTMIFKYRPSRSIGIIVTLKHIFILLKRIHILLPLIMMIIPPKKVLAWEARLMGILIHMFAIIGCAFGVLQIYGLECFYASSVFSCIGFIALYKYFTLDKTVDNASKKARKSVLDRLILRFNADLAGWKKEWHTTLGPKLNTRRNKTLVLVSGILFIVFLTWFPSPFRMFITYDEMDYPLNRIKYCMEETGVKSPNILYFDCTDMGLFNLTDTYPMDKYFCAYTLYTPEDLDYYNKYIINGRADFVISDRLQTILESYDYIKVFEETHVPFVSYGSYRNYYVYARSDLANCSADN